MEVFCIQGSGRLIIGILTSESSAIVFQVNERLLDFADDFIDISRFTVSAFKERFSLFYETEIFQFVILGLVQGVLGFIIDCFGIKSILIQLWEVELLFLVYYVSNYILKYFATSNADDKFQQIISSWRLFMNYSLTQEGQKYDFDRIRPQSTIQSRYLIFQKGKIEITTCNKRTAMTKINAVEDVQGRSTNSLNKLRQF
ncbi:Hypothetical_protein [Hexamita inflata]|uniref:Hypothetical_protein n=1 Tax=Hexamita inflata TaxID=28002 RepID=A0AA86VH78_9EUKA|nr:Hypothetical protein HINF_LOCUS54198 [Hexamita inflata]